MGMKYFGAWSVPEATTTIDFLTKRFDYSGDYVHLRLGLYYQFLCVKSYLVLIVSLLLIESSAQGVVWRRK